MNQNAMQDAARRGDEMFRRIFEPMPWGWESWFKAGDHVYLKRQDVFGFIPTGAQGIIKEIEAEGAMAEKGRPYYVEFDMRPYNIRIKDKIPASYIAQYALNPDEPIPASSSYFGPNDIELIGVLRRELYGLAQEGLLGGQLMVVWSKDDDTGLGSCRVAILHWGQVAMDHTRTGIVIPESQNEQGTIVTEILKEIDANAKAAQQ